MALTIDVEHPDRPTRTGVTEDILEALAARDVQATMFIQGRWAQAYPDLARTIAGAGHVIGCHSHFHARMPMLTRRGLTSDVQSATRAILDITGVDPRPWFRCPFGALDRGTAVLDQLRTLGYRNVGWNVDSRDWASGGATGVARRVIDGVVEHGDGSIVLMHGWPAPNPQAVARIVDELRDNGAIFVTVDALDALPSRAGWDNGPG
ncbi:MAG TPA: polysaccharide deacetylase family protein [Candidatus Limnocylindrales bacterium]